MQNKQAESKGGSDRQAANEQGKAITKPTGLYKGKKNRPRLSEAEHFSIMNWHATGVLGSFCHSAKGISGVNGILEAGVHQKSLQGGEEKQIPASDEDRSSSKSGNQEGRE